MLELYFRGDSITMRVETIKLYENRDDVTLTTYLLGGPLSPVNRKKRPAILVCPGGAYAFISPTEAEPIALRYASMGYHAFVLSYTVYNKGKMVNPMGELPVDEDSLYPGPMLDVGAAMLCIRDHAEEWCVDADKVVLTGFSAGAHNSAMYCTKWDSNIFTEHFGRPVEDFKPAGAILGYGYYDWVDFRKQNVEDPFARAMNESIDFGYFGTRHPSEEQLAEASPAFFVSKNTPPMFLWTTCEDMTLPSEQTMIMGAALAKAGVSYEVHTFNRGDHGYALADEATADSLEKVSDDAAMWMPLAQKWLRRNVPIELPEHPEFVFNPAEMFG